MGWQWHQLNDMQAIFTSLQKITTPAPHQSDFYGQMPFLTPNQQRQLKALKAKLLSCTSDMYSLVMLIVVIGVYALQYVHSAGIIHRVSIT